MPQRQPGESWGDPGPRGQCATRLGSAQTRTTPRAPSEESVHMRNPSTGTGDQNAPTDRPAAKRAGIGPGGSTVVCARTRSSSRI